MSGRIEQRDTNGGKTITVRIVLRGRTEDQALPMARAYLFDRADRLVDSKPIAADPVTFNIAADRAYRVTVGPELIAQAREAPANLEAQLAQARALSQDFVPNGPSSAEFRVNPNIWFCWFPTCINVHGTVTKQFSGSTTPICNGTVQIFQVDLGCSLDSFTVVDFVLFRQRLIEKITLSTTVSTQASSGRVNLSAEASSRITVFSSAHGSTSSLSLGAVATTLANSRRRGAEAVHRRQQADFVSVLVRTHSRLGLLLAGAHRGTHSVRRHLQRGNLLLVPCRLPRPLFRGSAEPERDRYRGLRPADRLQHLLRLRRLAERRHRRHRSSRCRLPPNQWTRSQLPICVADRDR